MEPTKEKLKELLWYDAESGDFYWRFSPSNNVQPWQKAGTLTPAGYVRISVFGRQREAHRLAYLYVYGEMPKVIDHINGSRSDNKLKNLRPATASSNGMNRGAQANNTSGYKGVFLDKRDNRFFAAITVNKKRIYLGRTKSAEEAHLLYVKAAGELHGEYAKH
jgi:hypothetical protein